MTEKRCRILWIPFLKWNIFIGNRQLGEKKDFKALDRNHGFSAIFETRILFLHGQNR